MLYQDRHSRVVLLLTGVLQGRMYVVPGFIRVHPLICPLSYPTGVSARTLRKYQLTNMHRLEKAQNRS